MIIIIEMKYYYPVQIEAIVMADLFDDELLMFVCVCVCVQDYGSFLPIKWLAGRSQRLNCLVKNQKTVAIETPGKKLILTRFV